MGYNMENTNKYTVKNFDVEQALNTNNGYNLAAYIAATTTRAIERSKQEWEKLISSIAKQLTAFSFKINALGELSNSQLITFIGASLDSDCQNLLQAAIEGIYTAIANDVQESSDIMTSGFKYCFAAIHKERKIKGLEGLSLDYLDDNQLSVLLSDIYGKCLVTSNIDNDKLNDALQVVAGQLTDKQRVIFTYVLKGFTSTQIADILHKSRGTINDVKNIIRHKVLTALPELKIDDNNIPKVDRR